MSPFRILIAGAAVLLLAAGGGAWWFLGGNGRDEVLPTPPDPPRLTDAPEYERCLDMLDDDPEGARSILDEVLQEGNATQKQEAERLLASLP